MASLDLESTDLVLAASVERSYPAGSYLYHHGDAGTGICIVDSGLLRIDRSSRTGRVTLLDLAIRGDVIGELAVLTDSPRSASLSTVTPVVVRHIATRRFRELMADVPALHAAITTRLAHRLQDLSMQFLETATLDASGRIAARLLRLVQIEQMLGRLPSDVSGSVDLKLPISQEELAQWSGLTREGAVKGISTLRSVGLIETGRMRVLITDLDALRQWR